MAIDTTKESICVNQLVGKKVESRTVEGDVIVPDIKPDILSPVQTAGTVCIYRKEILDGKVKIDGTVQVYVIYSSDDEAGTTRGLNTSMDFTETLAMPNCITGMDLVVKTVIESIDARVINGRKINIRATVDFELKVYSNENIDFISTINGLNDMQKLEKDISLDSLVGGGSTKAFAKETISVDTVDTIAEILNASVLLINKDTKVSYNKVLVKADALIRVLYLTEDNMIKSCQSNVPVTGIVDIQNVNENHICDVNYEIKNLIVKPNVGDEHSIYVETELEIFCSAYEKRNMTIIEDIYSPTQAISFTQKQIKIIENNDFFNDTFHVNEKMEIPELAGGKIYNVKIKPFVNMQRATNDEIDYEGDIKVDILFWNDIENRACNKIINLPMKYSLKVQGVNDNSDIETEITCGKQDISLLPDGNVGLNVDISFSVNSINYKDISVLDEITEDKNADNSSCSMVIYYVKSGDTLWNIAKQFRSTIEEITKINSIDNPETLQIGRQLFIPRFCFRQI
ncbi:MAG: DUF3794 domain-containing protein [Clostridia bacterium]|nr:DUF3794 domain-containing protein [Clostridia bacterium]